MKLTEKAVVQRDLPAELDEQFISDDDLTGLYLRLRRGAASVVKSWVYRYTVAGARHKETVDFAGHSLAAARKWAGDLQARVRLGYDPGRERAQARTRGRGDDAGDTADLPAAEKAEASGA